MSTVNFPVARGRDLGAYRILTLYNAILHPKTPTPHQVRQHHIREQPIPYHSNLIC